MHALGSHAALVRRSGLLEMSRLAPELSGLLLQVKGFVRLLHHALLLHSSHTLGYPALRSILLHAADTLLHAHFRLGTARCAATGHAEHHLFGPGMDL